MKNRANRITELHYPNEPNIHNQKYRLVRMKTLDELNLLTIPITVKSFICDAEEKGGDRCETQCLGCDGFQRMLYNYYM